MSLSKERLDYLESKFIISEGMRLKMEEEPQKFVEELRMMKSLPNAKRTIDSIEGELGKMEENEELTDQEQEEIVRKLEALGYIS